MCNLTGASNLKTVEVYKVVQKRKHNNKEYYASVFACLRLEVGNVRDMKFFSPLWRCGVWNKNKPTDILNNCLVETFNDIEYLYKVSGFVDLEQAENLQKDLSGPADSHYGETCIVKIKLSGNIWKGLSLGISKNVADDGIIYAGEIIDNIEFVK